MEQLTSKISIAPDLHNKDPEMNNKRFKEWWLATSSNLVAGLIVLFLGAMIAKPAYEHLLSVVQENRQDGKSTVSVAGSPNAQVTVSQVFQAVNEITNPQTVQALPPSYREPLQNLRRASEDVVAVFKDAPALNKPVSEFKNIAGADTVYVSSETQSLK